MFYDEMTLRNMIDFKPRAEEMAALDLDVVVWIKASVVSYSKEDNYNFIRFMFTDEEIPSYFKNYLKTRFYDYDGTVTFEERFVTFFELYSLMNYASTSIYLEDLLNRYTHEADVVIDFYTHDDKSYRLSDMDGVVKLEELNEEKEK